MEGSRKSLHPSPRPGPYFVTLVTYQGEELLGEKVGSQIVLSPAGRILKSVWQNIPERYPNIRLDTTVILANHLHGILWVLDPELETDSFWPLPPSTRPPQPPRDSSPPPEWFNPGALNTTITYVKQVTLQEIHQHRVIKVIDETKFWQHDHFELYIRTERELSAIRDYLQADLDRQAGNPLNGILGKFEP